MQENKEKETSKGQKEDCTARKGLKNTKEKKCEVNKIP